MIKSKLQLTIDNEPVSSKEFEAACEGEKNKHCIIGNHICGNHLFTSLEGFDSFCRNDPRLASIYIDSEQRRNRARKLVDELGQKKISSIVKRREDLCQSINELMRDLIGSYNFESYEDEIELLRSVIGPRVGTVGFYRSPNFGNQFRGWEGVAHISIENLHGDNNTLSSIRVGPAPHPFGITLYDRQCWDPTGQSRTFFTGPLSTNEIPYLSQHGFDNRTESWWFWA